MLLVDATASWCSPCHLMDRTTWVDPAVVEALREHAVAIQIDVDTKEDVAKALRIKAMPTVIAFRAGKEVDRVTGLQKRDQLLAWLDALARGETTLDMKRAEAAQKPDDMHARMALARQLLDAARLDEATNEYVWLWEHMLERQPSMYGVRLSYLARDLTELIAQHPPARGALERLRAQVAPSAVGQPEQEPLVDWFTLNSVLGENSASLAWFDAAHAKLVVDERLATTLERLVGPMLVEAGRWADLGALYKTPLVTLARASSMMKELTTGPASKIPEMAEQMREFAVKSLREKAAELVRALLAAGRTDDAKAVREEAQRLDSSEEMASALANGSRGADPHATSTVDDGTGLVE